MEGEDMCLFYCKKLFEEEEEEEEGQREKDLLCFSASKTR
jgi:hypothetical protein